MGEPSVTMRSSMCLMRLHTKSLRWLRATAVIALWALALALSGCWVIPPKVLTTADNPVPVAEHFPAALLAEPIQLRKGYTHTTQLFTIKGPKERWTVAIGFVRSDEALAPSQKADGGSDRCWTEGPHEGMRPRVCKNNTPGFNLQWELLRADGSVASRYTRDNLVEDGGGTYGANAITRTLSGFRDQPPGQYRLRVYVLRDAKELDFLKPHVLVNRPFFSSRAIE